MIEIIECMKSHKEGALKATITVKFIKTNMIVNSICIFETNGKQWASPPSRSYEKDGKKKYWPYIFFGEKEVHEKTMKAICDAYNEYQKQKASKQTEPIDQELPF